MRSQKAFGEGEQLRKKSLSRSNMNFDVHPTDDFYRFANGNWLENNHIPQEYSSWGSFLTLHAKNQERLKNIITELAEAPQEIISEDERKLCTIYKAAMDEETIERLGVEPLKGILDHVQATVDSMGDKTALAKNLGLLSFKYGISPFFKISAGLDLLNSEHSLAAIDEGTTSLLDLGLNDRYCCRHRKNCMAWMFTLLENVQAKEATDNNVALAEKVYNLENTLVQASKTRTENQDPYEEDKKMSIAELTTRCNDKFDFAAYFLGSTGKTVAQLGHIRVLDTKAVEKAVELASTVDPVTLLGYLRWTVVVLCAPFLPKAFVDVHFAYFNNYLFGTRQIKPRWKRAMGFIEGAMGDALGKLYCAKYFDKSSGDRALQMVEKVRQALQDRLKEVDWIKADSTRRQALKKLERLRVKIGRPDKWTDYSRLDIKEGDCFLEMAFKASEFQTLRKSEEMNAPTDKDRWCMTPQTTNAYYCQRLNEIVFPAAILQHPFFDKDADDAVNYGAFGAIVGHEMAHAFDDLGSKFDFNGVLNAWWTDEEYKEYERRVQVIVEQVDNGVFFVRGHLTRRENIADLGGLRLALRALQTTETYDPTSLIDCFTPIQRFYLSWAQCWRENIIYECSLRRSINDPHGSNKLRVNLPLSNMAEFHEAFGVKNIDPMFRSEETRVNIW